MTTDPRTCAHCGAQFVPGKFQRRMIYCGKACYGAVRKALNPLKCRDRYLKNREQHNAKTRAYYLRNRDLIRAQMRERWRQTRLASPWLHIMAGAKNRAKTTGAPFDLTDDWARQRWTGKCEISGIPFALMLTPEDMRMFAASIDRIDPKKGYVQDNCRFILFAINAMKQDGTDQDIYSIASSIVNKRLESPSHKVRQDSTR